MLVVVIEIRIDRDGSVPANVRPLAFEQEVVKPGSHTGMLGFAGDGCPQRARPLWSVRQGCRDGPDVLELEHRAEPLPIGRVLARVEAEGLGETVTRLIVAAIADDRLDDLMLPLVVGCGCGCGCVGELSEFDVNVVRFAHLSIVAAGCDNAVVNGSARGHYNRATVSQWLVACATRSDLPRKSFGAYSVSRSRSGTTDPLIGCRTPSSGSPLGSRVPLR